MMLLSLHFDVNWRDLELGVGVFLGSETYKPEITLLLGPFTLTLAFGDGHVEAQKYIMMSDIHYPSEYDVRGNAR